MNTLSLFANIKVFVFDIDGVLTNGNLIVLPNGVMARTMNVKDGYALQLAIKKGYKVVIISGGYSDELVERFKLLGICDVYLKVQDKLQVLKEFLASTDYNLHDCLFMGDDIPDAEIMEAVFLPCCPADAVTEIKQISKYQSLFKGGEGCARDVIEKVMKLQNNWQHTQQVTNK